MNLFGDSDYLEKLSLKGNPLERLEKVVDFECFRPTLNREDSLRLMTRYQTQRLSGTLEISYQNLIEGTGFFLPFKKNLNHKG
jgi:hypothetical protein